MMPRRRNVCAPAALGVVLMLSGTPWGWAENLAGEPPNESAAAVTSPPTAAGNSAENKDLELIPPAIREVPAATASAAASSAPPAGATQRLYLERALTAQLRRRAGVVPLPPPPAFDWQERLFFDARKRWDLGDGVDVSYSGRLNLRAENDMDHPNHENVINNLREAYVSWQPLARGYLDAGRINLKSGVALGYNPTEFFKTRAVVEALSADPTVRREDRLGTLMLRAQQVFDHGSLTAAFAPRLYSPSAIYSNLNLPSFDPSFDRTNAANRLLLKGTANLSANLSPELFYYRESGESRFGINVTGNLGQRSIAYVEWSGGTRPDLIEQALRFGRDTDTLPLSAPAVVPENIRRSFQTELALGASYTAWQNSRSILSITSTKPPSPQPTGAVGSRSARAARPLP